MMPNTLFIGDTHFGHKNIIKFEPEKRPWATIEEHDEALIANWNSVVNTIDTVWHLGDFSICGSGRMHMIAKRLNGIKKLVLGNHDKSRQLEPYFQFYGMCSYFDGVLSHMPVAIEQQGRFKHNIHGHLHSKNMSNSFYWNVSCEQINCIPIEYEELKRKYK